MRYYEDTGFVVPQRRKSGKPAFDESHIRMPAYIRQFRSLGFGVVECRTLMALCDGRDTGSLDDEPRQRPFLLSSIRCKTNFVPPLIGKSTSPIFLLNLK